MKQLVLREQPGDVRMQENPYKNTRCNINIPVRLVYCHINVAVK